MTGKPFACLVPHDLVNYVATVTRELAAAKVAPDSSVEEDFSNIQARVHAARKLVSLDTGRTWLVCDGSPARHHVSPIDVSAQAPPSATESDTKSQLPTDEVGDIHTTWVHEQQLELARLTSEARGEVIALKIGLLVDLCPNEVAKVLVPLGRRKALIEREHAASQHSGWKKVYQALSRSYTWAGMSAQVKRVVQACNACAINNGRRNLAHGQFSSVQAAGPRTAYAIDFYEVAMSAAGFCWILTIIDLCSHAVIFVPCKSREATEVVRALLRHVVNRKGIFLVLMCDEAKSLSESSSVACAKSWEPTESRPSPIIRGQT